MGNGIGPKRQACDGDTFGADLAIADTAKGLEVADIYALTILDDAGLEIVSIEVTGGE